MKSVSPTSTRPTSPWIQAMVWLIVALVVGVLTVMLWMTSSAPALQPDVATESEKTKAQMSIDFSQIHHVDELNELRKEVKPISFDALVRDLRQYPDEFKDKAYFKQHENDWTVQVMDVAEHKVITDYLDGRDDRKKFAYFRYLDENNQTRYILTYDALSTPQLAMGTAKLVDFNLPNNIRVLPEEMSRYLSLIDNYELSQPVENVNLNPTRRVELRPTQREIAPHPASEETDFTTTDTDNTGSQTADNAEFKPQVSIADSTDASDTLQVNVERRAKKDTNTEGVSKNGESLNNSATNKTSQKPAEGSENTQKPAIPMPTSATNQTAAANVVAPAPRPPAPRSPASKPVEATPPSSANNTTNSTSAPVSNKPQPAPSRSINNTDATPQLTINNPE